MKRLIENVTGGFGPSARVVDGTLVLTLPDAATPVVWQFDLGHAKASAMEVRTDDDGGATLILKTPRGDVNEIAHYEARGRAVQALMTVSHALNQAQGQMHPANDASTALSAPGKRGRMGGALTALIAVALVVVLFLIVSSIGPQRATLPGDVASSAASVNPAGGSAPADAAGVPVSADAFLQRR